MSLALYRKYRPATFGEVRGQDHVTEPLMQALTNDRLHHAYLFSGPRGCGKTSSARILARSMNCEQGPTPTPCGVCRSCIDLAPNGPGSLDVIELDAASHGGVDDTRDLREKALYSPVSSRFKIYILDEAHMISTAGFNALLKLVEEPPDYVKFVFATTEPEKVLGTIKSRTHHYPFRLVPPPVLRDLLAEVCAAEGVEVDPLVLPLVVRAGAGSVRDSLSVLDQLLAGGTADGVSYDRAVDLLGYTSAGLIDELADAFAAGDGAAVFQAVERATERGQDLRRLAADLLERLRDLVVLDAVPSASESGLITVPADQLERMVHQARGMGTAGLARAASLLAEGLTEMRGATAPRLQLELVCARILLPAASTGHDGMLARLDRVERRLDIAGDSPLPARADGSGQTREPTRVPDAGLPPRPTPTPTPAPAPAAPAPVAPAPVTPAPVPQPAQPAQAADDDGWPTAAAPGSGSAPSGLVPTAAAPPPEPAAPEPAAPEPAPQRPEPAAPRPEAPAAPAPSAASTVPGRTLDAAAVRRVWPDVMEAVKRRKRTPHAMLLDAQVVSVESRTLVLSFPAEVLARRFADPTSTSVLVEALHEVLGVDWDVRCGTGLAAAPEDSGPPPAPVGSGATSWEPAQAAAPVAAPTPTDRGRPGVDSFAEGDSAEDEPDEPDGAPERPRVSPEDAAMALLRSDLGATELPDR